MHNFLHHDHHTSKHHSTQGTLSEDSPHGHPESKQITVQHNHFQKAVRKGTELTARMHKQCGGRRSSLFWKAYFQVLQSGPWKTSCKGEIALVTHLFSAIYRSPIILLHQISRGPSCMLFPGMPTPQKMPPQLSLRTSVRSTRWLPIPRIGLWTQGSKAFSKSPPRALAENNPRKDEKHCKYMCIYGPAFPGIHPPRPWVYPFLTV